MQSVVMLRIVVRPLARIVALLKAFITLGFTVAGATIIGTVSDAEDGATQSWQDAVLAVAGVLLFLAALRVTVSLVRVAFSRRARLEIGPHGIVVHHKGLFTKPVTIARADIAVANADEQKARFRRFREHKRFSLIPPGPGEPIRPAWLYSKAGGAPLPLLSHVPDVPNLALVFDRPLSLEPVRRWVKPFPSKLLIHPPVHKRDSRGLLLNVKEIDRAKEVFTDWGIFRPITMTDLGSLAPSLQQTRQAARLRRRDNGILITLVTAQVALPLLFVDNVHQSPSPTPGVCDRLAAASEASAELDPPEGGDQVLGLGNLLPHGIEGGYELSESTGGDPPPSFDGLSSAAEKRSLEANGFDAGFYRRWRGAGGEVRGSVLSFDSAAGAAGFEAFLQGATCSAATDLIAVPEVAGAVAFLVHPIERATFTRGKRLFLIDVVHTSSAPDLALVSSIARQIDDNITTFTAT
jgi:hypothetical protein